MERETAYIRVMIKLNMQGMMVLKENEREVFEDDVSSESEDEMVVPTKKESSGLLLTVIRIVICALCICAALVIRWIGGNLHAQVGTWFYEHYNNSIFTDESQGTVPFRDDVSISETSLFSDKE